jgi:hypothetical protein
MDFQSVDDITRLHEHLGVRSHIYERDDKIVLKDIFVDKNNRNKGSGSALMQDLVNYADRVNKLIVLSAQPSSNKKSSLYRFYKRFGFILNKGRNIDFTLTGTHYRLPVGSLNEDVNYPMNFNIKQFKNLSSFAARIRYAQSLLTKIGAGSARVVYAVDDKTVLKLAKNKKGLAQNYVEGDWGLHNMYAGILPDLIDKDEDDLWLIIEKAEKIKPSEVEQLEGVKFKDYQYVVGKEITERSGRQYPYATSIDDYDAVRDNDFVNEVVEMAINFGFPVGDLTRISSLGKIDGRVVITDAGLTEDVMKEHYGHS